MKSVFRTALSAFGLAAVVFSQATLGQTPEPAPPIAPMSYNPTPLDCSCYTITINEINPKLKVGFKLTGFPAEANGNYWVNVKVKVRAGAACDPAVSLKLISANGTAEVDGGRIVPTALPTILGIREWSKDIEIPRAMVVEHGSEWKAKIVGTGTATKEPGVVYTNSCEALFTLGTGCKSCQTGTCDTSASNGSFTYEIPLGSAMGGDTTGSLRFFTKDFANPGIAALFAFVPKSSAVTRVDGKIVSVQTGANSIAVTATPTAFDPNAFTVTHRDPGGNDFRVTTIAMVNEGGTTSLRADSTYAGATYRHEQTEPQPGTLVLESGRVEGGIFVSLRRETHIVTKPNATTEVQRDIVEERATASDAYEAVSDVRATWKEFMWAWEKVEEVVDPTGAALTSTWSYYGPGELTGPGAATTGLGQLKSHVRYDGYQEFHTYWLNNHQIQQPFAGNPQGLTVLNSYHPQSRTRTITRSVGANVLSKSSETYDPDNNRRLRTVFTAANATLVTTEYHMPYGADFGGQPSRILAPDGTLTTYTYSRDATTGGKTVVMESGAGNGTSVTRGMRTTTSYNRFGTVIRKISQAIGYGTGDAIFDHMAVTSIDNVGRALTTAYFPTASSVTGDVASAPDAKWSTSQVFACCGVIEETDRTGIVTRHAYDSLRRRVKTNSLGVTNETAYKGRTAETHRYPEAVAATLSPTLAGTSATLVGRSVSNLAGTLQESWSPNPASATPGALVKSTTTTTYKPAAGLSARTVTTTADNFSQTSDSFLDGKSATTSGDLSPAMSFSYAVTATGLVTSQSYVDGGILRETTSSQSDWAGRQLRTDFSGGAFATMEYNATGQMVKSTDPDGVTSLRAYDSLGQPTVSAIDLNANGQIDYGTDTVTFSESGPALNGSAPVLRSVQKVWQPGDTNPSAGTVVSTSLSAPDGLSSSRTSLGVANPATSVTTLGSNGNMTQQQTSPDGSYSISTVVAGRPDVSAFYNSAGTLIASSAVRASTNTPGSGYDSLNRPTHHYDSRTGVSTTAYLSTTADLAASTTDPGNRITSFTYDIRGRRVSVDAPDTLDANGVLLTNVTTTSYFPKGNIQEVNGGQTYRVAHTYDYAKRQKTLTTYGATPATTTWTYSPTRGFLARKEYADGKGTNYTYTAAGRLATRTWARGVVTTYGYDSGGRLTTTTYSDTTPAVTLAYDALGRKVSEIQVNRSAFTFTYNPATLAPATESLAYDLNADGIPDFTRVLDRSRDTLGRDTGWQLKNGATVDNAVTYNFDTAGRLGNVTSPAGSFTYAYQSNSMDLINTVTGPAHIVANTWDSTRDVLTRKENKVGASIISAYDYTVNPLGQRTNVANTGTAFASSRSTAWGYDSLGQVTKADSSVSGFDRAYQYDAIGNRKKAADGLTLPTADNYTANALNQYTAVGAIVPTYDDDGNATAYPVPTRLTANSTLAWDAENRMKSATVNGVTTTYLYDSGSRRIAQTTGSTTTVYVYDAWNPVAEYTGSTLKKTYTWGSDLSGSLQGAGGVGGLLAVIDQVATGKPSYFPAFDGNGNVSEYLSAAGATVAHYEYDPFGRSTTSTGTLASSFAHRFSTKPVDGPTGLYYYGYRYLDPVTGRWLSRDPIEESGGVHLTAFLANSALDKIDAFGLADAPREIDFPYADIATKLTEVKKKYADISALPDHSDPNKVAATKCRFKQWNYIEAQDQDIPWRDTFSATIFDFFGVVREPITTVNIQKLLYITSSQKLATVKGPYGSSGTVTLDKNQWIAFKGDLEIFVPVKVKYRLWRCSCEAETAGPSFQALYKEYIRAEINSWDAEWKNVDILAGENHYSVSLGFGGFGLDPLAKN
jgi:RHS repeat-associated protein